MYWLTCVTLMLTRNVNRNGGVAMDVCSDANVKNHVNMSGGVSFEVCCK